jgi:glycosyltransferase involved in cell wall biosynthesis
MKKILFSGELPPRSIHGVASSNEINIKFLRERFDVIIDEEYVDLRFHAKLNVSKFQNYFSRLKRVIFFSFKYKFDFFYIVFSTSKVGAIKTLLLIVLFRIFNFSSICVVHLHRGDLKEFVDRSKFNRILFYLTIKITHRLIVLSEKTKNYIDSEFYGGIGVFILPNTVNDEVVFNDKYEIFLEKEKAIKFIYISNYIAEKGILLLLETFKQLDNNFQLHCHGNFSDLTLKEKILAFSSEKIKINGPIIGRKKYEIINESDALILPSFNEGKPIVLLEAMLVGTPFIAPDVGYIKEMVFEKYPFIYEQNTSENLLDTIIKFSSITKDKRSKIRESLKTHYFENYSNAKHKNKLYQIFSE